MISTFLIVKNERFFLLLEPFLNAQGIAIAEISNDPQKAKDRLGEVQPDIVIMDANWFQHKSHTLKLVSDIVLDHPEQKIILVTTFFEPRFEKFAIDAGAHGYFCRGAENIAAITSCIKKVANGAYHFS